jgi:hypothetical protein
MPTRQNDQSQNGSHQPHNSPSIFSGRMGATPMHHDILLPGASAPESLSLHANHAAHAVCCRRRAAAPLFARAGSQAGTDERNFLCDRRTEDGKQSSADVLESCVGHSPQSCACLRGRPRARPPASPARSAWIKRVRAAGTSFSACSCARTSQPTSPAPPRQPRRDPCSDQGPAVPRDSRPPCISRVVWDRPSKPCGRDSCLARPACAAVPSYPPCVCLWWKTEKMSPFHPL